MDGQDARVVADGLVLRVAHHLDRDELRAERHHVQLRPHLPKQEATSSAQDETRVSANIIDTKAMDTKVASFVSRSSESCGWLCAPDLFVLLEHFWDDLALDPPALELEDGSSVRLRELRCGKKRR